MNTTLANIIVVVIFLLIIGVLFYVGKTREAKNILLGLVTQVELNVLGDKKGRARFLIVIGEFYKYMPWIIKILWTQDQIVSAIEDAVALMKKELTDDK